MGGGGGGGVAMDIYVHCCQRAVRMWIRDTAGVSLKEALLYCVCSSVGGGVTINAVLLCLLLSVAVVCTSVLLS